MLINNTLRENAANGVQVVDYYKADGIDKCKRCGGKGWMRSELYDKPIYCVCATKSRLAEYRKSIDSVIMSTPHLINRLPVGSPSVKDIKMGDMNYYWGLPGTGKTNIARAIAKAVPFALAMNERDMLEQFYANAKGAPNFAQLIEYWPALIIDDLGSARGKDVTEFAEAAVLKVIDIHYEYSLGCLITSNMSPKELTETYGSRAARRILSGNVMEAKRTW